jgi:hypothetical protein
MPMLLMLRGAAWVFLSVALSAGLDWFKTWLPKDSVEGVSEVCANAGEPGMRRKRKGKRAVLPKKRLVPYFAGLELKLWK